MPALLCCPCGLDDPAGVDVVLVEVDVGGSGGSGGNRGSALAAGKKIEATSKIRYITSDP